MDDRASFKQFSSVRLQKAINKNQTFDTELKKELQMLEEKKKASEKAFEQKRTQFLRNRLCLKPLKKSQSFCREYDLEKRGQERVRTTGLLNLRTSYSTGNIFESMLSSRKDLFYFENGRPGRKSQEKYKLFKKFSLDSAKEDSIRENEWKGCSEAFDQLLEPCLTNQCSNSCSEEHFPYYGEVNFTTIESQSKSSNEAATLKKLKVPHCFTKKIYNDENFSGTEESRHEASTYRRNERFKSWDATNRLSIPPIDNQLSKSDGSLSRKDDTEVNGKMHLSLPPLTRTRSRSMELVKVSHENDSSLLFQQIKSGDNDCLSVRHKTDPLQNLLSSGAIKKRHSPTNNALTAFEAVYGRLFEKPGEGQSRKEEGAKKLRPKKTERSQSTPDLIDIEPEVEYLLLKDDKIRLRRMRAAAHAISLMGDMKDYRYLRNVEFLHQEQETNSQSTRLVSGSDQSDYSPMETFDSGVLSRREPNHKKIGSDTEDAHERQVNTLEPRLLENRDCGIIQNLPNEEDVSDLGDEPTTDEEDRLNMSTASCLADMFDEIRHTRYLRIRPQMSCGDLDDDGDDDGDGDCNKSHGYRVPMIIVGHTKAVLAEEETKNTDVKYITNRPEAR